MTEPHVISFGADGSVEAMQNDKFPLSFLGRPTNRRASELTHDADTDTWGIHLCRYDENGVRLPDQLIEEGAGFPTYSDCRKMEVKWLNECRLRQVEPESVAGRAILALFRQEADPAIQGFTA